MPRIADFVVVPGTDQSITLPGPAGINDFHSHPFDLPDVNVGSRSVLAWRVNPQDLPVRVQVNINNQEGLIRTFDTDPERSLHEVVRADVLRTTNNVLDIVVLGSQGRVMVSDFVLFFQANI